MAINKNPSLTNIGVLNADDEFLQRNIRDFQNEIEVLSIVSQNYRKFRGLTYVENKHILKELKEKLLKCVLQKYQVDTIFK